MMLFCVDLRTCCFIIGYLVLTTRSIKLLYNTVSMVPIMIVIKEINNLKEGNAKYLKTVSIIYSVDLFVLFMDIITAVILIVGLHKKNRKLVHVFLVTTVIYFALGVIVFACGVSISADTYMAADWFRFACEFLYKCVYVFCVYVIRRYYRMISKREEGFCVYDNFAAGSKPD